MVVMPDHLHALITPSYDHSLDRCVECIKGGFTLAIGRAHQAASAIWRKGFQGELVRHAEDYVRCRSRIAQNPESWGLREHAHLHVSGQHLDPMPRHLRG
jgi:REP element-mobilizing transposase RayT